MQFREAVEIEAIEKNAKRILDSIDGIIEFGHCTGHHDESGAMRLRSKKLQDAMAIIENELDAWHTEMQNWYGN